MLARVLLIVAIVYAVWRLVGGTRSGAVAARFPCSTCTHCRSELDDGVICMFAGRETFMNEVHIANCSSWKRRERRGRSA